MIHDGDAHQYLAGPAGPGCIEDVHALLDAVWREAPQLGSSERARFTLIVAELVANVVEHGASERDVPPHLELTVDVHGGAIRGTLIDDGAEPPRGAPGGRKLSAPTHDEASQQPVTGDEVGGLRESGRGLMLVRSVADELALTREGQRNRWRFVVRPRTRFSRRDPR